MNKLLVVLCVLWVVSVEAKPLDAYCSKRITEVDMIESIDWSPEVEEILYYLKHYNSWHDIKDEVYNLRKKLMKEYRKEVRRKKAKCSGWKKRKRKKIVVKPKKIVIFN